MSEDSPQSNPVLAWAKDHQVPSIFIGLGIIVILGLLLSAVLGEDSETVTVEITMPSDSATPSTASPEDVRSDDSPQIAPIHACGLLTEFEVIEALGVPYSAESIFEEGGIGRLRDGPDGGFVQEECGWSYYSNSDAWVDSDWTMGVRLGPADPQDFEPGAALDGAARE